jgi:hypothetical protein
LEEYLSGLRHLETHAPHYQPPIVFAAAPAIAAGAGLTLAQIALIAAILALAAILLLAAVSPEFKKKAEILKSEIVDAGVKVIAENIADVELIDHQVEICRRQANVTNPKCLDALSRFDQKKGEIVVKRNNLMDILRRLASKVTSIFQKADAKAAVELTKELARLMSELMDIVREIMNECGCRFLGQLPNKPPPIIGPVIPL